MKEIVGIHAKKLLKDRTQRKAFKRAIAQAAEQLANEFPDIVLSIFDEHFVQSIIADELQLFMTRHKTPSVARIVEAYENQFIDKPKIDIRLAAVRFVELIEEYCKEEHTLQNLLSHRHIDESTRILRHLMQLQGIPGFGIADSSVTPGIHYEEAPSPDENAVINAFQNASCDLLDWPQTLDGKHWIDRPELQQLLDRIAESDYSGALLLGVPGSGKSALLARLAQLSIANGSAVMAIKADQLPEEIGSLEGLRKHYEFPAPILDCVRHIARKKKVILLFDQLDALGELVDLKTLRLRVLLRLINQAHGIKNVHIVASCRSFERIYDKRLSTMEAEDVELALPVWERIEKILSEKGISASNWPESFREILRVPQYLKLFLCHFTGADELHVFETYQAMLDRLWSNVFSGPSHYKDLSLVYDIATEMADNEVLFVPTVRYEKQRLHLDYAISVGILHLDRAGRQIRFTHQTLFDFARARAFIVRKESLSHYVLERQTGLFVRPKLWSALHFLRGSDPHAYQGELKAIWGAPDLRPHIKMLLIDYLGQQEQPFDFEIQLLRPIFSDETYKANALSAVAGRKMWFDVIVDDELPEAMRALPDKAWGTVRILESAWPFAKDQVLNLLIRLWVPDATKHYHTWFTLRALDKWDRRALVAAITIVEQGTVSNREVHDLATTISNSAPDLAPELVGAQIKKQVLAATKTRTPKPELPEDATQEDMFSSLMKYHSSDPLRKIVEEHGEWFDLSEVALAAPNAFLEYVWPPLKEIIEKISEEDSSIVARYREDYLLATNLGLDEVDDIESRRNDNYLVDSLVHAVRECAKNNFSYFRTFVEDNQSSIALTVHRLIAIGLCEAASKDPKFALDYLLGDERRLSLGKTHMNTRETTMLLQALIPHLSDSECGQVEEVILKADKYRDLASEKQPKDRLDLHKLNRMFRLRLLLEFPKERLSHSTRRLVESELRTFPSVKRRRRPAIEWTTSTSPMSANEMVTASDKTVEDFIAAFPDATGWGERFERDAGSVEVSREFAEFAKKEPERAIAIILKFDHTTHQRPAAYAIRELTNNELEDQVLFDLVLKLDSKGFASEEFRECAANALLKRVKRKRGLPDPLIDVLERWLAECVIEAAKKDAITTEENGDIGDNKTSNSLLWGLGSVHALPGGTYSILNTLFFGLIARDPVPSEKILSILRRHVSRGDRVEVWDALAFDTLRRLHFCDQHEAQDFLSFLFSSYPILLARNSGVILVAYTLGWCKPGIVREWMEQILMSKWKRAHQAYGELLGLRTVLVKNDQWSRSEIEKILAHCSSRTNGDRQVLLGLMHAASNLWNDVEDRTLLAQILCYGMNSTDTNIAAAAIDWFRVLGNLRFNDETRPVLEALAGGNALEAMGTHSFVLDQLAEIVDDAPELVYKVTRRVIEINKENIGNLATSAAHYSETLISIAITLQRQEEPHRSRGLDLFELLLRYNAYRSRDVLMDIDRRPGRSMPISKVHRRRKKRRTRSN